VNVVELNSPGLALNMRQLLTPLFFPWGGKRHPDMKRQASRRQRAKELRAARALKAMDVPLRMVDPTVYLRDYNWEGKPRWTMVTLQKAYGSSYRRRVHETCVEVEDGD
jgi:hypothetical protein